MSCPSNRSLIPVTWPVATFSMARVLPFHGGSAWVTALKPECHCPWTQRCNSCAWISAPAQFQHPYWGVWLWNDALWMSIHHPGPVKGYNIHAGKHCERMWSQNHIWMYFVFVAFILCNNTKYWYIFYGFSWKSNFAIPNVPEVFKVYWIVKSDSCGKEGPILDGSYFLLHSPRIQGEPVKFRCCQLFW